MTVFRGLRPCLRAVTARVGEDGGGRHSPQVPKLSARGRRMVPRGRAARQCLSAATGGAVEWPWVRLLLGEAGQTSALWPQGLWERLSV